MAADGSIGADADPTRWRDAREWFQKRRQVLRDSAAQTERDARLRAFRVAGITSVSLITEVHQAIDDALRDGTTLDEFKKRVGAKLAEEWGAPNARRVETIFRTNVQSAYNAGRYAEMTRPAVLAVRPFWKFVSILDGRTTATCAPLNGVIRKHDDAFWKDHYPPLHFNCRSTVVSLSRGEAERAGGVKDPPKAKAPGEGFGTSPDLAADGVKPRAASQDVVRTLEERARAPREGQSVERPDMEVLAWDDAIAVVTEVYGDERVSRWLDTKGVGVYPQSDIVEVEDLDTDGNVVDVRRLIGHYREGKLRISTRCGRYQGFFNPGDDFVDEGAPTARDGFARILWHEFAHAVHDRTSPDLQTRIHDAWVSAVRTGAFVSGYARDTREEWWAEVFAAYRYEPDALADIDPDGSIRALVRRILRAEDLE